ncbi:hypothetical protein ACWFMI_23615 [Nocardiopsis terrae]
MSKSEDPTPITLDPDLEPWAQQPGESDIHYGYFRHHLDAGRGRVLARTADELDRNQSYLRQIAGARLWRQRINAYEAERDQIQREIWVEKCKEAAEADAKILGAAAGKLAQRLMSMRPEQLSDGDFVRLLDVVMRHRRQLLGPTAQVQVDHTVHTRTQLDDDILNLLDDLEANDHNQETPLDQ